ncbi:hypothetical protein PVAP13_6KG025505 [Panicum virgatum]|uniref:Endonuclease/exonuclease/phosphatase domain-containing protein n=1 Tax=Panicum virgatum TaxID=38727 RepID=A0A8T0R6K8_PANVG|nr:hypothetical protein PVAP13_6KG025505 [Panicum virgatum]
MSCLSWNCRGLGNGATVKELRDLTKSVAPTVLCVLETQVHKTRVEGLKTTLGFDNSFAVSSSGRSGGLVLHRSEHEGVQERSYAQIEGFREMVDVCSLHDFEFLTGHASAGSRLQRTRARA